MAENEVPRSREMPTGEAPSGNTSDTEPRLAPTPVGWNSQKSLEGMIKVLQHMAWIKNDKGQQVRFEGVVKEDFIRLCQQKDLMFAHAQQVHCAEICAFLSEAKGLLRPLKLYDRWLKMVGLDVAAASGLVRLYKRYGDHLNRFAYLGLKKLRLISELEDCVGYVVRHEKAISGQTEQELKQLVMALKTRWKYPEAQSRGHEPTWLEDRRHTAKPELDSTGSLVEGKTRENRRQQIRARSCPRKPTQRSRLVLVDSQQDHVEDLEIILRCHGYEIQKIVLPHVPYQARLTAQQIYAAHPDLVIINLRPFSGIGNATPHGHEIAVFLNTRFPHVPVVFYNLYGEDPRSSRRKPEDWLWMPNTIAFLTTPFEELEVLDTVMSALQLSRSRNELLRVSHNLQTELALGAEELQRANQQLEKEVLERKRAEQSAIESKQQLQAVFDCAADPVFIKDHFFTYRMVNPAMERLMGMTESEIIGKTDEDLFGQEAFEHFREVEQRVLNGESIEEEHSRQVHGLELTFLDSRVPWRDSHGAIVGICGISRDVTERRGIEQGKSAIEGEYLSAAMHACLSQARVAAQTDSIVLLLGESGSGKDHVAKYIHQNSKRANGPCFSINCAAIAPELAESELFGHEAGAFTGAQRRKRGLLELAEGGTLLLNEIGELPPALQAKLLTFLDTRRFTRVGAEQEIVVNARLIAATNTDLEKEVAGGRFRNDLFYRINVMTIRVPPLRDRLDDLPALVQEILETLCSELQFPKIPVVTRSSLKALEAYHWPGNVRELRNVLERALLLMENSQLRIDLPESRSKRSRGQEQGGESVWAEQQSDPIWSVQFPPPKGLEDMARDLKRALIEEALRRARGNKSKAARLLGITRDALNRHIKTLGISSGSKTHSAD